VLQALVLKLKPPQLPTSQKLAVDVMGKAFTNTLNQQSVKDRMSRFSLFTTGQAIPTLSLCSKKPLQSNHERSAIEIYCKQTKVNQTTMHMLLHCLVYLRKVSNALQVRNAFSST
jgi:hypothetical protein